MGTIVIVLGLEALRGWTSARWLFAAATAAVSALAIGLPTDVIPNPVFGRQGTPVDPWATPVLAITAVLSGLLFATYFQADDTVETDDAGRLDRPSRLCVVQEVACLIPGRWYWPLRISMSGRYMRNSM
jgi:hypothetical protein